MNNVSIRLGTAHDFPLLERIELEAIALFPPHTLSPQFMRATDPETLTAGVVSSTLWVAVAAGAGVVGFLLARAHGSALHIEEMDVLPACARQGIGTMLLEHACDAASERRYTHMTLTTFGHLPWNAPFYMRHGFEHGADLATFPYLETALRYERERGLEHRVALIKNVL